MLPSLSPNAVTISTTLAVVLHHLHHLKAAIKDIVYWLKATNTEFECWLQGLSTHQPQTHPKNHLRCTSIVSLPHSPLQQDSRHSTDTLTFPHLADLQTALQTTVACLQSVDARLTSWQLPSSYFHANSNTAPSPSYLCSPVSKQHKVILKDTVPWLNVTDTEVDCLIPELPRLPPIPTAHSLPQAQPTSHPNSSTTTLLTTPLTHSCGKTTIPH